MNIGTMVEKCQAPRRSKDTWYGLFVARKVSIYITFLFVKAGIHAMAATTIFFVFGVLSALMFALGGRWGSLAAVILLQMWYILDHVDGEVARFHEETSLTGKYYDELTHYIVHPLVFAGLGYGVFRMTGNAAGIYAGLISGFSIVLLNLIIDIKNLMLLRNFHRGGEIGGSPREKGTSARADKSVTGVKKTVNGVYSLCTFPVIMNVLTLAAVIDLIFRSALLAAVLYFYTFLLSIVWIARLTVFIRKRQVDISWRTGDYK